MKRLIIYLAVLAIIFPASPLAAGEQLMSKLYFDSWLKTATTPLEQQISQLRKVFTEVEAAAFEIKNLMTTEIKIVIGQLTAEIDGKKVPIDAAPAIVNGRTMVPVRFIGEAFGASFAWNEQKRQVTFTMGGIDIVLLIDKNTATVNGQQVTLDAAPYITNGRTMVPLRFVGQHMQADFGWEEATRTITITR